MSQEPLLRETWCEFSRRCDERHQGIEEKLGEVIHRLETLGGLVQRQDAIERLVWWQRVLLLLVFAVVAMQPVGQAIARVLPLVRP